MPQFVHYGYSDGSTCASVALGAGARLEVHSDNGMHVYSESTAALGDFTGSATGELAGTHCLLNIIEEAFAEGTIARNDYVLMHTDSEVVWGYIARNIRPRMAYLSPLVALVRRRIEYLRFIGLSMDLMWITRVDNSEADRLARAALRTALRTTRQLRTTTPTAVFMVDWRLSGAMQDALYHATRATAF